MSRRHPIASVPLAELDAPDEDRTDIRRTLSQLQAEISEIRRGVEGLTGMLVAMPQEPVIKSTKAAQLLKVNRREFWRLVKVEQLLEPLPDRPYMFKRRDVLELRNILQTGQFSGKR